MGALMGGGVGLTIGFLFGSWSIIRSGSVLFVSAALSYLSLSTGVEQVPVASLRPSLSIC
jgi:Reactive mitochondrial oxygen species modulator 1